MVSKKVQLHVFNKFPEFTQKSKQASNLQDLESLQPESCSMSWEMTRPFSQEQQMVKEGAPYNPKIRAGVGFGTDAMTVNQH